jgi:hydroxypyruvate isomerase
MGVPARDIARHSLNLGWTFAGLALPDQIRAARRAGFQHVECHFPYAWPPSALRRTLADAGIDLVSINAPPGTKGELGLAALEGAENRFLQSVEQAIGYARALGVPMIHVLSGIADVTTSTEKRVVENFRRAAEIAAADGLTLLMEPLNRRDTPGYFLTRPAQALNLIDRIGMTNVRLMLDCYHVGMNETDPMADIECSARRAAHIQIAAVPSHAEPDEGTLDYQAVFDVLDQVGYDGLVGAEYVPRGRTEDGFAWMRRLGIVAGRAG